MHHSGKTNVAELALGELVRRLTRAVEVLGSSPVARHSVF